MELLKFLVTEETEVISIIYGNGIQEEDVSGITATIGQLKPDCDIEVSYGGQPFKYFIVSVE
jgi:dihydroxyacetone kinase-like predicted kinase